MIESQKSDISGQPAFLTIGFRPFFLCAGLYAIIAMAAWIAWLMLHGANAVILKPTIAIPAHLWHGHEMLFGYVGAAISGFMLTALPGWTGARRVAGGRLVGLVMIWAAGRMVMWFSAFLPTFAVAAVDMAYLPLLAGIVAFGLVQRPAPRNLIFLALLSVLIISNAAFHGEWAGLTGDSASWGLGVALLTSVLLIVILGGRIVPAFTRNAMVRKGHAENLPGSSRIIDMASVAGVSAVVFCYALALSDTVIGIVAAVAAVANLARWSMWRWSATLSEPIVWSLHLAYLWVCLGLAALSAAMLGDWLSHSAAMHLLAIGAIGGMTLAMMTRAPLGHTGRSLTVSGPVTIAYLLVATAALLRGIGLEYLPVDYFALILAAGTLWMAGFLIFVVTYTPILIGPPLEQRDQD